MLNSTAKKGFIRSTNLLCVPVIDVYLFAFCLLSFVVLFLVLVFLDPKDLLFDS